MDASLGLRQTGSCDALIDRRALSVAGVGLVAASAGCAPFPFFAWKAPLL